MSSFRFRLLAFAAAVVLAAAGTSSACPSDRSKIFGSGGFAVYPPGLPGEARDVAVSRDGIVYVAGEIRRQPTIWRYTADGTLDRQYGYFSLAQVGFEGSFGRLVLLEDGTVLATGVAIVPAAPPETGNVYGIVLARFDPSGDRDQSFGTDGLVISRFPYTTAGGFLVRSDGMIVMAGQRFEGTSHPSVAYFTPDGLPSAAHADALILEGFDYAYIEAAVEAENGSIVVAGFDATGIGSRNFLAKLDAEGRIDPGFGNDGFVFLRSPDFPERISAIERDDEGRLYVSGQRQRQSENVTWSPKRVFVKRFNADGSRDTSYGNDGEAVMRFPRYGFADDLAVSNDGMATVIARTRGGYRLLRFTPDGAVDVTFGKLGVRGMPGARSVALHEDGNIVVAGNRGGLPFVVKLNGGIWDSNEPCVFGCGDGSIAPYEECDDANTISGDGCSAACRVE